MQPVSLLLEGEYWDSQIYSGELTLFGAEGSYHRINWSELIDEMALAHPAIQTALRVAFSDSDLFYTQKVRKILRDPDIEVVIKRQLNALASFALEASEQSWSKFWRTSDSPFDFLPVDTDIYYHHVFAGSDSGLFSALRSGASSKLLKQSARRHHDGRILQVKASNQSTAIAAAAGSDGLLEFAFKSTSETLLDELRTLAKRPCSSCEWAFQSVFAWDTVAAYLANFRREKDPRTNRAHRVFDQVIGEERMFGNGAATVDSYVWGSNEKIFKLNASGLEVVNYAPPPDRKPGDGQSIAKPTDSELFKSLGSKELNIDPTQIVATGTAPFGSIVELPDRLVVLRSDNEVNVFPGEPVHWRVFPRSEHYSNQLHIVYEDRIQIVSFVHDYFVEQKSKLTGFARGSNDFIVRHPVAKDA
ncbi:conserved hypothetical protein [Rubrivivax sp. A210]|uniref:hypothetical protein n=1 Tax=Rubrivivax sp. A210 TaxID=2772301 RepID=UPI001917E2DF|nr:hypothetical protein [Rubrivivax sp. A210]CAD5373566.1 conserved hypothetical protein [Rubrivivax sp. A210]